MLFQHLNLAFNQGFFVFTYVKEVYSVIIYELIIHTETKKKNKRGYSPNCPLGNWKKPFFSFWEFITKKPGLSQNKINNNKYGIINNDD